MCTYVNARCHENLISKTARKLRVVCPPWGFPRREKRREEKRREEEPRTNYASHTGLSDSMRIEVRRSESSSRPVFRVSHGVSQSAATFFYRPFVGSVRCLGPRWMIALSGSSSWTRVTRTATVSLVRGSWGQRGRLLHFDISAIYCGAT